MAVREDVRGRGIGGRLLEELASEATSRFSALALNVHLRNPSVRLYYAGVSKSRERGAAGTE